jgi:hypothetical protein
MKLTEEMIAWNKKMEERSREVKKDEKVSFKDQKDTLKMLYN